LNINYVAYVLSCSESSWNTQTTTNGMGWTQATLLKLQ